MPFSKSEKTKNEVITARCGSEIKEILHIMSVLEKQSMSDILAKSVIEYQKRHYPDIFETESKFFGRFGSGKGDLSVNRKKYLKEAILGKHGHS